MDKEYDFHADMIAAMAEPLCDELQRHVIDSELFGKGIYHPLVHQPMAFIPGHANRLFEQNKRRLHDAAVAKDWSQWVFVHERPYRADALATVGDHMGYDDKDGEFAALAREVWVDSENIHQHLDFWRDVFDNTVGAYWMDESERKAYDELPERLMIYRGECNDLGVSWTTDYEIAKFFANRKLNEATGVISKGFVSKKDIFAALQGRGEAEIIVIDRTKVDWDHQIT